MVRVLALIADPEYDGQRLHQRFGWQDPFSGVDQAVADLNLGFEGSTVSYQADKVEVALPPFGHRNPDGSKTGINEINTSEPVFLNPAEWVLQWMTLGWQPERWPGNGNLHIKWFLEHEVLPRLAGYDEVWLSGMPMPAAFEGGMLAPEWDLAAPRMGTRFLQPFSVAPAIPCNLSLPKGTLQAPVSLDWLKSYRTHDTLVNVPGIDKRYVLHMFQASNHNPCHNFVHRCEAILHHIWGSGWRGYEEQWSGPVAPSNLRSYNDLFGMTDNCGLGFVGSGHFLVSNKIGYEYRMDDIVPSGAHLFKDFPSGFPIDLATIRDKMRLVSARDWAHLHDPLIWWLQHLPRNPGKTDGRWNDWTKYVADVNDETGRHEPTSRPVVGQLPMELPWMRYGNNVVARFSAHDGDDPNGVYSLAPDGTTTATLRRRGEVHTKLSLGGPLARVSYTLRGPGWETYYGSAQNVPLLDSVPAPEEPMIGLQQTKDTIADMHLTLPDLANCSPPEQWSQSGVWYYARWPSKAPGAGMIFGVDGMNWGPGTVRSKYMEFMTVPANRAALCVGVTPPPPPVEITMNQIIAGVRALYEPGARYAGCVPPDFWADEIGGYRAYWNFEGNNLLVAKPVASLDDAVAKFIQGYSILPARDALCQQAPPPPPEPEPEPTPASFKPLLLALADADEARARVLREHAGRL